MANFNEKDAARRGFSDELAQQEAANKNAPQGTQQGAQRADVAAGYQPNPQDQAVRIEPVRPGDPIAGPPPNAPLPVDGAASDSLGGPPKAATPAPPVHSPYPFSVMPGKSISTLRGIIDAGLEIRATDLAPGKDGEERLEELVKNGSVNKKQDPKDTTNKQSAPTKP